MMLCLSFLRYFIICVTIYFNFSTSVTRYICNYAMTLKGILLCAVLNIFIVYYLLA